ncbi:MAG: tRNA (adenosine(37)-N6)-dimethylallyltransferase MiaA [Pseudomonadota bacterium]|nr:tRNA (adenosine(37)-N6)-dimethylallyltransferase MiaA [Pseudomonadota bacterium]
MQKQKVIVIAGPTASGKSQLAIDAALAVGGVVVNADSMQVYRNTPIISACPSAEDKALVAHRLYEIWDAEKNGSVVDWLNLAVAEIKNIWRDGKIPVVVGGTGLYLDNLINGTTPIPETSPEVRDKVKKMLEDNGVRRLHDMLAEFDPPSAAKLNPNDTTRVRRALEVYFDTGKALSAWHKLPMIKKLPDAAFWIVKIVPMAEELDGRCFRRFDQMISGGAPDEAAALSARHLDRRLPAMRALGVPELMDYAEGKTTLEEAVMLGKLHTRQYAKRQRTWFNNKLKADLVLNQCYSGQKEVIENIIKFVKS